MCRETAFLTLPVICGLQLLHFERYWPTGILIHRQNTCSPRSWQYIGRHEIQSCELVNKGNNHLYKRLKLVGNQAYKH
jgi:hypothetical protein